MGNCDVHCRVVDVLLQKGPWNISKGERGEGEGRVREGILNNLFYLILFYFIFSEMVSPPDVSSLRGVKRKLIN